MLGVCRSWHVLRKCLFSHLAPWARQRWCGVVMSLVGISWRKHVIHIFVFFRVYMRTIWYLPEYLRVWYQVPVPVMCFLVFATMDVLFCNEKWKRCFVGEIEDLVKSHLLCTSYHIYLVWHVWYFVERATCFIFMAPWRINASMCFLLLRIYVGSMNGKRTYMSFTLHRSLYPPTSNTPSPCWLFTLEVMRRTWD